jgi:hypothetical protein
MLGVAFSLIHASAFSRHLSSVRRGIQYLLGALGERCSNVKPD